ncbi:MAG: bifunctional heptose 7-phosphate kinase/heptose 1-phosphate adenyltransferase [Bacteriovoracaceae bacterium]
MISENRFHEILSRFHTILPVLVVGDVGIDKYTFGEVRRISPEAPVPVLEVTKEWQKLGLASNVTDNLQSLGVTSTLCGVIGDDNMGNVFEHLLEEQKLKTWGLVRVSNRSTILKERVITNTQQICRIDYESKEPIDSETKNKILSRTNALNPNHSALIIEDYGKGLISEDVAQALINAYIEMGKIICVDPSRSTPPLWYKGATLLKPNRHEAIIMAEYLGYKEKDISKIASLLVEKLNLKKIIITLSSEGMALLDTEHDGKMHVIPTVANEVFDVSGAGDTAISAITASLIAGGTLEEAAWIGNCASGVVVGKKGTALVNQDELKTFYNNLKNKLKNA